MRDRVIRQYCARVGYRLPCGRAQRQALLAGLEQELFEHGFPEDLTLAELYSELGTPESLAQSFSDDILDERPLHRVCAFRLCVALAALVVVHIALHAAPRRH